MATKQELKRELMFLRGMTYVEWIEFGIYLLENYGDDEVLKNGYRRLCNRFIETAKTDMTLNPNTELLALPADIKAKEDRLRLSGWK